jgi:hypothetical protein
MKTFWESEEEGNYVAVVDMEDGSGQQRFEGATHKEVADKMMVAQANATALIKTQATKIKETAPVEHAKPVTEFKAKPLSADERLEVTTDLSDATKAPEAVKKIVESALGAPLDTVRERLGAQQQADLKAEREAICKAFIAEQADFMPCKHNWDLIIGMGDNLNLAFTRTNLDSIWEKLKTAGLAILKPTTDTPPADDEAPAQPESTQPAGGLPAQPAATTRPRGTVSTGLRAGDSSAVPPSGRATPKYTRKQINDMSAEEYDYKFKNEPGFAQLVDRL